MYGILDLRKALSPHFTTTRLVRHRVVLSLVGTTTGQLLNHVRLEVPKGAQEVLVMTCTLGARASLEKAVGLPGRGASGKKASTILTTPYSRHLAVTSRACIPPGVDKPISW